MSANRTSGGSKRTPVKGGSPRSSKPAASGQEEQQTILRAQVADKYQKRQLRRQIRETLEALPEGDLCEVEQILAFLEKHHDSPELVREVLTQLPYIPRDSFPFSLIWQFATGSSLEVVNRQLEVRQVLVSLIRQRNALAAKLPDPLLISVENVEQGSPFSSLTPADIREHIEILAGYALPDVQVIGPFPFTHPGDYSLQLDFSYEVTLSVILRLEIASDALPEDCADDFKEITALTIPEQSEVVTFLQEQWQQISPQDFAAYCERLGVILVTAYKYGYSRVPWIQDILTEWRSKRDDYIAFKAIQEAINHVEQEHLWRLPVDVAFEALDETVFQNLTQLWLAQDPVFAQHDLRLAIEERDEGEPTVIITWKGWTVGIVHLSSEGNLSAQETTEDQQVLESTLQKVLQPHAPTPVFIRQTSELQEVTPFFKLLRREVLEASSLSNEGVLPDTLQALLEGQYEYDTYQARADHFLRLARSYGEKGNETFMRYALVEYCFSRGQQRYRETRKEARPYLQGFLLLESQSPPEGQHVFLRALYRSLALYFGTYNLRVEVGESVANEIAGRFYSSLIQLFASISKGQEEGLLGRCLVEIAAIHPWVMADIFNRMKLRKSDTQYLQLIAGYLQEARVFRVDPLTCLQLLARIDPALIGSAFTRQSLSNAEERRRVVNALLTFASSPTAPPPEVLLKSFATHDSHDTRRLLAFSLLVEPFILPAPQKESTLKATLISEALGLPAGIVATEFFLSKATELAQLFDLFQSNQDPNIKGRYAITILETIRSTRRSLIEHLRAQINDRDFREALNEVILRFFRTTEGYVTAEQAKLIYDTTLELVLISDRTLHDPRGTRITVEIRNIGEGIADHVVLEVWPVPGNYSVEERHRQHSIDTITDKTPVQIELFILPEVETSSNIELSLALHYDTLKKKDKLAELAPTNRVVWLYPESQFVHVPQPYNPGAPATTWFYGRKNQLERMADNLREGSEHDTSMIVYGIKRAGKTSVVKRFINHTLQEQGLSQSHIPIYDDLQLRTGTIKTDGDFLYFLLEVIINKLSNQGYHLPFDLEQAREKFQKSPQEAFSLHLKQILSVLGDQRLLLVLDEFSDLYSVLIERRSLTPNLFGFLSNTIQSTPLLTFIFTGTYMLLDMMRTHMYSLAKICFPMMISYLDETSARQLITEPVQYNPKKPKQGWLEYDPRVVDRIIIYTHCHPYLIQYICMHLVNRINDLKYHRVNLNDLNAVISDIITRPEHDYLMTNMWNEFASPQQKVLSVIASLASTSQEQVDISDIVATFQKLREEITLDNITPICKKLEDARLLERTNSPTDQSEGYSISIPLYQMWLKQNKPLHVVFGRRIIESPSY